MKVILERGDCITFEEDQCRRLLLLKVNTLCNLRCRYCWNFVSPQLGADPQEQLSSTSLLESLRRLDLGRCDVVYLSGGEPVLRDDIVEICRHLRDTGATLYLTTNGTLLNRLLSVAHLIDGYVISVDSAESGYHDSWRGRHKETVTNLRTLARDYPICVTVTLSQGNLGQLGALADRCLEWGAKSIFCQLLWFPRNHPGRRTSCLGESHSCAFKLAMDELRIRASSLQIPSEPYLDLLEAIVANDGAKGQVHDCFALSGYYHIDPRGEVAGCLPHDAPGKHCRTGLSETAPYVKGNRPCEYFSEECSCLMGHFCSELF